MVDAGEGHPPYRVELTRAAEKDLRALNRPEQQRVGVAIDGLEHDPRPAGAKALQGLPFLRIRVGHVRIVYAVDDAGRVVVVQVIGPQGKVYRLTDRRLR